MAKENGQWIMHGKSWDDPQRVTSWQQLIGRVDEIGFLPLFKNGVEGLSVEEMTLPAAWWCDDPAQDPWLWRQEMAASGRVAYGKFFEGKAGFVSLGWLPDFANYRRDGYDFDALWEDGKANRRSKKLMDCFLQQPRWTGPQLRQQAGFGPGGEKNFEGTLTRLQMQSYLVICGFERKVGRSGAPYGMPVAAYATPEQLWGGGGIAQAYAREPSQSGRRILAHLQALSPASTPAQLQKVLGRAAGSGRGEG